MPKPKQRATCHPDKPLRGLGKCEPCYGKAYRAIPTNKARRKLVRDVYEHTNREAHVYRNRADNLARKYGITEKQWDIMYDRQGGVCPIDGTKLFRYHEKPGRRAAPVDHDHKTGRVRGLLCFTCNRWRVGRNTVETAQRVLDYLTHPFDGRAI